MHEMTTLVESGQGNHDSARGNDTKGVHQWGSQGDTGGHAMSCHQWGSQVGTHGYADGTGVGNLPQNRGGLPLPLNQQVVDLGD